MKKRVLTRATQDPERLDTFLAERLHMSSDETRELIARGAVHVDGRRITSAGPLALGAKLVVFLEPVVSAKREPLTIAHQDEWLAVVDKPAGVPVQAERSASEHALDAQVRSQLGPEARLLHRLDKEASGLVLFALRPQARAPLHELLTLGSIDRRYIAIVAGDVPPQGTISLRIGRHPTDARLRAALPVDAPAGQAASSHYRAIARANGLTAVELTLETGRTHQLRVHMAALGHPLVGDMAYGGQAHARLCLHAYRLVLPHPRTRARLAVESRLPATFSDLVPGLTTPLG